MSPAGLGSCDVEVHSSIALSVEVWYGVRALAGMAAGVADGYFAGVAMGVEVAAQNWPCVPLRISGAVTGYAGVLGVEIPGDICQRV